MPFSDYTNREKKTGIRVFLGVDHNHEEGQKNCQTCLQNQIDFYANRLWQTSKAHWDRIKLNITIAMVRFFEPEVKRQSLKSRKHS